MEDTVTVAAPIFRPTDVFTPFVIGGFYYEIATVRSPTTVRLVRMSQKEQRRYMRWTGLTRRLDRWLAG